jgi:hypothetical protein
MMTTIIIRLCLMMLMMIGGLRLYHPTLSVCPVLPNVLGLLDIMEPRRPDMLTPVSRLAADVRLHLPRSDIEHANSHILRTIHGTPEHNQASQVDFCPPSVLPRSDYPSSHSQSSQKPSRVRIAPTSSAFPTPASQQAIARSKQRDLELRCPGLVDRGPAVNHRS